MGDEPKGEPGFYLFPFLLSVSRFTFLVPLSHLSLFSEFVGTQPAINHRCHDDFPAVPNIILENKDIAVAQVCVTERKSVHFVHSY